MTRAHFKQAINSSYDDIVRHHVFQAAAALSYYFILAVFPGLIVLSAVMGLVPVPHLFGHVIRLMTRLLPQNSMSMVRPVIRSVLQANHGAWLSAGALGLIWVLSAAFDALIEALDMAYDVVDERPFWKTRLIAIGLGLMTGLLLTIALIIMILGPRFGEWLASRIDLSNVFVVLWMPVHWLVAVAFTIMSVEAIYFLAPNVKQRFRATLPGAILAVGSWLALSWGLGYYFRHFGTYNRIYGTLSGFIALMTWFYWNAFALLVGAELNAELAKQSKKGPIPGKQNDPEPEQLKRAA